MNEFIKLSECRPHIIPIRPMNPMGLISPVGPVRSSELSQKPGRCYATHIQRRSNASQRTFIKKTQKIKKEHKSTTKKNKKMLRAHRHTVLDSLSLRRLRGRQAEGQLVAPTPRVVVQRRRKRSGGGGEGARWNLRFCKALRTSCLLAASLCRIRAKY